MLRPSPSHWGSRSLALRTHSPPISIKSSRRSAYILDILERSSMDNGIALLVLERGLSVMRVGLIRALIGLCLPRQLRTSFLVEESSVSRATCRQAPARTGLGLGANNWSAIYPAQ